VTTQEVNQEKGLAGPTMAKPVLKVQEYWQLKNVFAFHLFAFFTSYSDETWTTWDSV